MSRARSISPYLYLLAILFVVGALYIQAPTHFFISDDFDLLIMPLPQSLGDWLAPLNLTWQSIHSWYRPLPQLYYVALFRPLFHNHPAPYMTLGLGILLANVALVYGVARRLTHQSFTALLITFLYAVNFIHAETIGWMSGIIELLLTLFSLLMLLTYIKWEQQRVAGKNQVWLRWLAFLFFLLAIGSKETAIVLPIWLAAYSFLSQNYSGRLPERVFKIVRAQLPFYLFTAVYLFVRYPLIRARAGGETAYGFRLGATPLFHYSWFVRWIADLFLYPLNLVKDAVAPDIRLGNLAWAALGGILVLAVLVALWFWFRSRGRPSLSFDSSHLRLVLLGIVWFVVGLLPVAFGANQAAYYLALPAVGAYLALGVVLAALLQWIAQRSRTVAFAAAILLLLFITWGSFQRVASIERNDVPARGRIAQQTIESLQFLRDSNMRSVTVYLIGFPPEVWPRLSADHALKAFYPNVDATVILADGNQVTTTPNDSTILVRYQDGRVTAQMNLP